MIAGRRTRSDPQIQGLAKPILASEAGDSPAAYANPAFRRLLANGIAWVASEEARAWARGGDRRAEPVAGLAAVPAAS